MKFGRWKYQKLRIGFEVPMADAVQTRRSMAIAIACGKGASRCVPSQNKRGPAGPRSRTSSNGRSGLFLKDRAAARLADLVDVGLHFLRRLLAEQADYVDHQEAERHSQQSAGDVVEVEPA